MNEYTNNEQHAADALYEWLTAVRDEGVDRSDPTRALAADLIALRPQPEAAFAQELEASLRAIVVGQQAPFMSPNGRKTKRAGLMKTRWFRSRPAHLWEAVAATVIMVSVFLAVPGLRSFAQDIIREIGGIRLLNGPTETEKSVSQMNSSTPLPRPTLEPGVTPVQQAYEVRRMTLAQAEAEAGFHAYEPTYVPEGFAVWGRDTWIRNGQTIWGDQRKVIQTTYYNNGEALSPSAQEKYGHTGEPRLDISQNLFVEGDVSDLAIGDSPVADVTVRGHAGIWIEQAQMGAYADEAGQWHTTGENILIWEENGFTFSVRSNVLPLDEMLKVAESLR